MLNVQCPTCKKHAEYSPSNAFRPFCSERCKLIDLGDWASEKHAIPCENQSELDELIEEKERLF